MKLSHLSLLSLTKKRRHDDEEIKTVPSVTEVGTDLNRLAWAHRFCLFIWIPLLCVARWEKSHCKNLYYYFYIEK